MRSSRRFVVVAFTLAVIASGCGSIGRSNGTGTGPSPVEKSIGNLDFVTNDLTPFFSKFREITPQSPGALEVRVFWFTGGAMNICADTYSSEQDYSNRAANAGVVPRESACGEGTKELRLRLDPRYDGGFRIISVHSMQPMPNQTGQISIMLVQ